ncbi:hypothetical protein DFH06DRAFT_1325495 [Mycena polygramma]|nr:hypothetical protein DFH06DRAFT_1325492 [Mycena polygramma]KAJ7662184.1 hypothetical protein DFH06DRAFT_1325495 [Mycena polygramma]
MPPGRPKGSKNKPGHDAGGSRSGAGPKKRKNEKASKKSIGKRSERDEDSEGHHGGASKKSLGKRKGFRAIATPPWCPSVKSTEIQPFYLNSSSNKRSSGGGQAYKASQNSSYVRHATTGDEYSSGSTTPNLPSLPNIPILVPDDDIPSLNAAPTGILDDTTTRTTSNIQLQPSGSDTNDPPPEDEPEPEGVVQAHLLKTMLDVKVQLKLHKSPDCYRLHKTFWIRPSDRWFILDEYKSNPEALSPDPLYHPDVFVWLPKSLLPPDFKFRCIFCERDYMTDWGWNRNPIARRVVNLDSCYFILSKRIRCESESCHKSCSLYEDKILAQLPKHLANEFPAFLTHRSGIDKKVVTLIRTGIAQALTPHAWERIFRELHVRNRDLGEQAYVHALKAADPSRLPKKLVPFSLFGDKKGYAGFTPSRWYINSVYIDYMSYVKPYQDQAMAAIPVTIASWDQSFKIPKYVARINGVRVFGSLWTMVNEVEQIRQMIFTPTQHLHHIEGPLRGVVRSLHEHGHQPISLLWTDNVKADHLFAERVIPTLRVGLSSGPSDNTSYPAVVIPPDPVIHIASSPQLIEQACSSIMSTIGDETTGKTISVGFSVEWDWRASQSGHFPASLMQIATQEIIYLLQIYQIVPPVKVPASLKALLFSKRVTKVGYHIQGSLDLLVLLWDLKPSEGTTSGQVDIGVLAKSKGLVPSATVSFQNITEAVLRKSMNSLQEMRCSDWCRQDLSADQKTYAIRNAWVSLEIFKAIVDRPPAGARLSKVGLLGDKVTLRNGDVNVAHGFFPEQPTKFVLPGSDTIINISRTKRAVITVTDILAPAFLCHHHSQSLSDMGAPPFDIVVDLASLIAREECTMQFPTLSIHPTPDPPEFESGYENHEDLTNQTDWDERSQGDSSEEDPFEWDFESRLDPDMDSAGYGIHSVAQTVAAVDRTVEDEPGGDDYEQHMDPQIDAIIATHPDPTETTHHPLVQPSDASLLRPTRTLQDVWHEMRRVTHTIDQRHSLTKQFSRWLRDAILVPDKIDRAQVEAVLKKGNLTWSQAVRSKPEWVWARVRRYIAPPEYLESVLDTLFKTHANVTCSTHGIKLFNADTHKAAQAMLADVRRGWLTDPPGVALYNRLRIDKNGLTIWHDLRGTNSLEGGVHRPVRDQFASLGASVELTVALLSDFCYRKNVESGSRHREGVEYDGHYDPWIEDDIDIVFQSLPFDAPRQTRPGYLNVSLFKKTHESFIVAALPQIVRDNYNIPRHAQLPSTDEKNNAILNMPFAGLSGARSDRYDFLASAQDTKFAVTPLHTNEEYALFNKELRPSGEFSVAKGPPDFKRMAQWWSERVDGKKIFYKFPEHFQAHFKTWNALRAELTTMQITEHERAHFMEIVRSDAHASVVLDESFSPVVQGRKTAASSAKIAIRNRQNRDVLEEQNMPEASTSKGTSSRLPPPPPPPPQQPPPIQTQFRITAQPASTTAGPKAATAGASAEKRRKTCAVCKSAVAIVQQ